MYLPYEILREIIILSDTQTIVNSFSVCKKIYELSQDDEFWSERVDKENLCDSKIFKEFLTYEQTNDLEKLTKDVVKSDNMELIHLFDNIRIKFSFLNKEQVQKYVVSLTTSAPSLYTFFYKLKYYRGECSRRLRRGRICKKETLYLHDYCIRCFCRMSKESCGSLFINFNPHEFIVMEKNSLERIIRDIAINFVFHNKYYTCILIGKLDKGTIISVSEEDRNVARAIYKNDIFTYIIP